MRHLLIVGALALAGCHLGGCTSLGRAAVGELPPMDLGVQHPVSCADLIGEVRKAADAVDRNQAEAGIGLPFDVDGLRRRNTDLQKQLAQTDAMVSWCERRATSTRVKIDLERARQGVGAILPF